MLTGCSPLFRSLAFATLALLLCLPRPVSLGASEPMERIVVTRDQSGFAFEKSGRAFRPWGVNYGNAGRLMEDFWDTEWETLAEDFRKIRGLGGNVVRVHLQFGKFMQAADRPNPATFAKLRQLVELAESTGLYLDVTGLACYRPSDVPAWYDELSDAARWKAQAVFWERVAEVCAGSPAIFCYNLMNEPVSPGEKGEKWYSGVLLGGYDFIQYIARDPAGRSRGEIAVQWIDHLTAAIRKHDRTRLVTVGLLPWVTGWKHLSGFIPAEIAPHVDFISVHIYPKTKQPDEAPRALKECAVGKPVVIEETFPLECTPAELESFLRDSKSIAFGWMFHYDGETAAEIDAAGLKVPLTPAKAIWRAGLQIFEKLRPELAPAEDQG